MLGTIVRQVAALAKSGEVAQVVVAGIMVAVRARQNHTSGTMTACDHALDQQRLLLSFAPGAGQPPRSFASTVAPVSALLIPPTPVVQTPHFPPVWTAAALAPSFRPPEPDQAGELGPVDRV